MRRVDHFVKACLLIEFQITLWHSLILTKVFVKMHISDEQPHKVGNDPALPLVAKRYKFPVNNG